MGGGGGFNPIPIITTLVFGPEAGALASAAMGIATQGSGGSSGSGDAAAQAQAESNRLAEEQAAQTRRAEDRRAEEAQLKSARRQQALAAQGSLGATLSGGADAETGGQLGGPALQRSNLKEKLGQ
jgi:hypothetical protein